MNKLITIWFKIVDVLAWTLIALCIFGATSYPFVEPIHAHMSDRPITAFGIISAYMIWLAVAGGAFAITRRKALGLLAILVPTMKLLFSGHIFFALTTAAVLLVIFSSPFVLAFIHARSNMRSKHAA